MKCWQRRASADGGGKRRAVTQDRWRGAAATGKKSGEARRRRREGAGWENKAQAQRALAYRRRDTGECCAEAPLIQHLLLYQHARKR